jgi:hypothetical protein
MTADDMIAAFEAQLADPIISLAVAPSYPAENRIEKIDDYTVQYNLLRPSAHFPVNLTSQLGMIPPASYSPLRLKIRRWTRCRSGRARSRSSADPGRQDRPRALRRLLAGHRQHLPRRHRILADHRHRDRCRAGGRRRH